jgi:hypothetical protein
MGKTTYEPSYEWEREPTNKDTTSYELWIENEKETRIDATEQIFQDCGIICSLQQFDKEGFTLVLQKCIVILGVLHDVYIFSFINKTNHKYRFVSIKRGMFGFVEKTKRVTDFEKVRR